MRQWTGFYVDSGIARLRAAWQNSRASFARPDEEMIFLDLNKVVTNMPRKHLRAFLKYAEAKVSPFWWDDDAE